MAKKVAVVAHPPTAVADRLLVVVVVPASVREVGRLQVVHGQRAKCNKLLEELQPGKYQVTHREH